MLKFVYSIASMVMMHPARSSNSNNAGIAVISFDLSATLFDPRQDDAHFAHALQGVSRFPCSLSGTFEGLTINRITCAPSVSTIDCTISESNAQILWG